MKQDSLTENTGITAGYSCGLSSIHYAGSRYASDGYEYSSEPHCGLYNVASRIVVDGGRRIIAATAMAGMLAQNFEVPGYAKVISTGETETVSVLRVSSGYIVSGSGAILNVYGSVYSTLVYSGGTENIYSSGTPGGLAVSTTVYSSGIQNVYDGGLASSTTIYVGGVQAIRLGGIVSGFNVYNGGTQIVHNGGSAVDGFLHVGARQDIISGGVANSTIIARTALQYVHPGGSSFNVYQDSRGILLADVGVDGDYYNTYISGKTYKEKPFLLEHGVASGFMINGGGSVSSSFNIRDGASAIMTEVNSGGRINISGGGVAISTTINDSGTQYVLGNGIASDTIISYGGSLVVSSGGYAVNYVLNGGNIYVEKGGFANMYSVRNSTEIVDEDMVAQNAGLFSGGSQVVSKNGTANSTLINSDGVQIVYSGGTANSTVITDGGSQILRHGAIGNSTTIYSGGVQYISGNANDVEVNSGGIAFASGNLVNAEVNNGASMYVGDGTASNVNVNSGGQMHVEGGSAISANVGEMGAMSVYGAGSALYASVYGTQRISTGGFAGYTEIYSGGRQVVSTVGARTDYAVVHSLGRLTVSNGGSAAVTYIGKEGQLVVSDGGSAGNITVESGGSLTILDGGIANHVEVLPGGWMTISTGGTVSGYISHADAVVVDREGSILSSAVDNHTANVTEATVSDEVILSEGIQHVNSGGKSLNTNIYPEGSMVVESGGSASRTFVYSGAEQTVKSGGSAILAHVNYGGILNVESGGKVSSARINSNGTMENAGLGYGNIVNGGTQTVASDGKEYDAIVQSAGNQIVQEGGTVFDALVRSNGVQTVSSGGTASGTQITQSGIQNVLNGGMAKDIQVYDGGIQNVYGGGIVSNNVVGFGGTVNAYSGAVFMGNTVLREGGIVALKREGTAPARVAFDVLDADGGIIDMSVNLENKTGDMITISGKNTGSALISLTNTGSSESALLGDELKLVEYASEAKEAEGAGFSLVGGKWDAGAYEYTLEQGDENGHYPKDYYLRNTKNKTALFKTLAATPAIGINAIRVTMNSLQKRMGDLRELDTAKTNNAMWARGYYQSMTLDGLADTDMSVAGMEAGYDFKLINRRSSHAFTGPEFYLGFMAGTYTISNIKTKTNIMTNRGDGNGVSGGVYGTYISSDQWFADFTMRYGTMKLDITNYASDGKKMTFTPKRSMMAFTLETGKRYDLDYNDMDLKLEPKAEVQFVRAGRKKTEVENGNSMLELGGADYLSGIASMYLSCKIVTENHYIVEPFAEASYRQDLSGEEKVTYSGVTTNSSIEGGSLAGRIGLNMKMSNDTYWYAAASYENGKNIRSWGGDFGVRLMFAFTGAEMY